MITLGELLRRRKFLKAWLNRVLKKRKQEDGLYGDHFMASQLQNSLSEIDYLISYIKMKGKGGI